MMRVASVATSEGATAAARSRLYSLLAGSFQYPDREFFDALKDGRYRNEIAATREALPRDVGPTIDGLVASGSYIDFQAAYLRLFEVGLGVPPCPLYAGLYQGGRKAVMEELTRFYGFFGLSIEHGAGELPDHVATELEFMHFLAFKELGALERQKDPTPYRLAQADFLERQLVCWLPALEARLQGMEPPPFYTALVLLTNAFARAELAWFESTLERTAALSLEAVR